MRLLVLLGCLLATPAVLAQEGEPAGESAWRVFDECVDVLPEDAIGMEDIEAECPGMRDALAELHLDQFIPKWQHKRIGRVGLIRLQSAVWRYSQPQETTAIQVDSLQPVLDQLHQPKQVEQTQGWFERFKRWLREALKGADDERESWFSRWLNEHPLSETARSILLYGAILVIVGLAIAVVINEARVASKGRRKGGPTTARTAGSGAHAFADVDLADLDAAARADRPSLVLRMLVATLVKTGRLRAERSLTHTELAASARFEDSSQRDDFRRVAQLAERVVYGGTARATDDDVDEVVKAGRTLNSRLSGAAS